MPWSKAALQFRQRVGFLRRAEGDEWPDLSDEGLARNAAEWLEPLVLDKTARSQIGADELSNAVMNLLPWNLRRRLDAEAPTHFTAPTGSAVPIDYEAEQGPTVSIRVQELFGLAAHPSIAGGRVPLVIELLSPAHRPVQVTRDLPGFWRGSYAASKERDARPLSQAPLAGRPAHRAPHPPRQTADVRLIPPPLAGEGGERKRAGWGFSQLARNPTPARLRAPTLPFQGRDGDCGGALMTTLATRLTRRSPSSHLPAHR